MKTKKQTLNEKTWKGLVVKKEIRFIGEMRHYIFTFRNGGNIHVMTKEVLSIQANDIIEFNCTVHGSMFFGFNVKKVGSKFNNKKTSRLQNTFNRVKGY